MADVAVFVDVTKMLVVLVSGTVLVAITVVKTVLVFGGKVVGTYTVVNDVVVFDTTGV